MRFYAALALCFLLSSGALSASFTYLGFMNGTNYDDNDDSYSFSYPSGLLVAGEKLYVADLGKNSLFIMNASAYGDGSTNISPRLRALKSSGSYSPLENPMRMTYYNGTVYVADGTSTVVKSYPSIGLETYEWNSRSGSNLQKASGVAFANDSAYITDMAQGRLYIYSTATRSYQRVGIDKGPSDGQLEAPADVELFGGRVLVSDQGKKLVYVYDSNLTFLYAIGRGLGGVTLTSPRGIEVYNGRIYVADATSNRVVVFTMEGYPVDMLDSKTPGGNLSGPEDIAVAEGKLYVADSLDRQVRVYEINESKGDETVLSLLTQANQSIAALSLLQAAAQRLNLSIASSEQPMLDLLTAQGEYDHYMFSSASTLAQKALDESSAAQANLSQAIEVKILQIIKGEQGRVEPFRRQGLPPELSQKLAYFDNAASDARIKLSAKDYNAAIGIALSLHSIAGDYIAGVEGKDRLDNERAQNRTGAQLTEALSSLYRRLGKLKAQSESYFQPANFTNSESLLASANASMGEGDYDSANRSMALAEFEISSYEGSLGAAAAEIDAALSNISIIEFQLNSSAAKPMLLHPDLAPEQQQLASARSIAYSNPKLAVAMALQASSSAAAKVSESQTLSVAASAVLVLVGLIAVIFLAFALHIYSRRRQRRRRDEMDGGDGEQPGQRGEEAAEKPPRQHIWKDYEE